MDGVQHLFVEYKLGMEIPTEGIFGNVVFRRAYATCEQQHIGSAKANIQRMLDHLCIIAYCCDGNYFKTIFGKLTCHPCRIGVNDLSDEQFIANSNNFDFHLCFSSKITSQVNTESSYPQTIPLPLPRIRQTTLFEPDKKISLRPTLHNKKQDYLFFYSN